MCEQCQQAWRDLYPQLKKWAGWEDLTEEDARAYDILFSYTGFPMVSPEDVKEQLQYLCDHGPAAAVDYIMRVVDASRDEIEMCRIRAELPFRQWYKDKDGNWERKGYEWWQGNIKSYAFEIVGGKPKWKRDPVDPRQLQRLADKKNG